MAAEQNKASAVDFQVVCNQPVDHDFLVSWAVDQDLGQPDMCTVTIRNENHDYTSGKGKVSIGDKLEITAGESKVSVFKGEVSGIEPVYKANGENVIIVRAFNRLHRLLRGTKSRTFLNQSDQDIVTQVAGDHNLIPKCGDKTKIPHEHVYQHNQTDLEFLRTRAARIGYEVWVDGDDLYFDAPDNAKDSGIKLRYGDAKTSVEKDQVFLKRFSPRMSSAAVVDEVTVRGWDPLKKQEIVAVAKPRASKLGTTNASDAKKNFGNVSTFEVDHPIFSPEEAQAIADAKLAESMMGYLTGDGDCRGTPEIRPGVVITITVNPDQPEDRFNGKYMVAGASHRYSHAKFGDTGGYVTSFRVNRDAEGQ